ncbi:MAG TPA: glycosyl hydrolase family 18 protein [Bacteroidota bacterium]
MLPLMKHLVQFVLLSTVALSVSSSQSPMPGAGHEDDREIGIHQYFSEIYKHYEAEHPAVRIGTAYEIRSRFSRQVPLKKEVFGYFPYWFTSRWNLVDYSLLSTIAYFSAEVGGNGLITNVHGWPRYPGDPDASANVINMINAAHQEGVRVVLCVTNFDGNEIHTLVSSPSSRNLLIQNALGLVQAASADGVNINFEGVQNASKPYVTLFMQALADSFHTRIPGSHVSCAPTDFDIRYNGGDWDLAAIEPYVDMFFFQGYNYYYSGSSVTGPVGLLPNTSFWGSLNITSLIDNVVLARIDTTKALLGVPHYGLRWLAVSGSAKAATQGSGSAFYYPDALVTTAQYGRQWDVVGQNPWYRYQVGSQWYQGWYDDPESMGYKYAFVFNRHLQGIGMWALGQDNGNHDIWDVLASYFVDSTATRVLISSDSPGRFLLQQNFPNPFNPFTKIKFTLSGRDMTTLSVFDVLGREVAVLLHEVLEGGEYSASFSAVDIPSGVYFYRLSSGTNISARKMILMR